MVRVQSGEPPHPNVDNRWYNMKISYDTLAKAVYIELEKTRVAKTKEFAPEVFLDFDYKGELIGVELLNPGTLYLRKIAKTFHKPELARVHPRVIAEKAYV